jgi:hypothetical protein
MSATDYWNKSKDGRHSACNIYNNIKYPALQRAWHIRKAEVTDGAGLISCILIDMGEQMSANISSYFIICASAATSVQLAPRYVSRKSVQLFHCLYPINIHCQLRLLSSCSYY